jgi:hypothetical protein
MDSVSIDRSHLGLFVVESLFFQLFFYKRNSPVFSYRLPSAWSFRNKKQKVKTNQPVDDGD